MEANNNAKLRDALKAVKAVNDGRPHDAPGYEINDIVEEALAAPPRNCDVGTAEEQYARFARSCHANADLIGRCRAACPFKPASAVFRDRSECFARWSQTHYEDGCKEGGAK